MTSSEINEWRHNYDERNKDVTVLEATLNAVVQALETSEREREALERERDEARAKALIEARDYWKPRVAELEEALRRIADEGDCNGMSAVQEVARAALDKKGDGNG